jgi:hypothetical protein
VASGSSRVGGADPVRLEPDRDSEEARTAHRRRIVAHPERLPFALTGGPVADQVELARAAEVRIDARGFEIVVEGTPRGPDDTEEPRAYADAGVTW